MRNAWSFAEGFVTGRFDRLSRDPAVAEIDILAHSMGNWLVMETLRQMAIRDRRPPAKISDVMLAAPDIDVDQFDNDIADMGVPRPRFTLFASKDDRALALSGWIWGSDARLAAIDPTAEPYKSHLAKDNVTVYDLSRLDQDLFERVARSTHTLAIP